MIHKERLLKTVFEALPVAMLLVDKEASIRYANSLCETLGGYSPRDLIGADLGKLIPEESRARHRHYFARYLQKMDSREMGKGFDIYLVHESGELVPVQIFLNPLTVGHHTFIACYIRNLTVVKQTSEKLRITEQNLQKAAHYDSLTSLPNRDSFEQVLHKTVKQYGATNQFFALLFIDVDNFKQVNDSFGHHKGDEIIQHVANFIHKTIRNADFVARYGGDELVVLMPDIGDPGEATALARRLIDNYSSNPVLGLQRCRTTLSIGIAVYPVDADDASGVVRCADTAMYKAKQAGRNTYAFYLDRTDDASGKEMRLEHCLASALANNEFHVVYQPLIEARTGSIYGVEVLLRWHNAEFGTVSPEYFIPIAERKGLINEIGEWVMQTAFRDMNQWLTRAQHHFPARGLVLSMNISMCQLLDSSFRERLEDCINYYALDPRLIMLELTETVLMQNLERAIIALRDLQNIGVGIAIDDFGTGYSSMSYLKYLPFSMLKIDKSFVNTLLESNSDKAIVQAIIELGKALDISIVAEGVETRSHLERLGEMGCHYAQGYYIAVPLAPETLPEAISTIDRGGRRGETTS